jgi:hypothetical protein
VAPKRAASAKKTPRQARAVDTSMESVAPSPDESEEEIQARAQATFTEMILNGQVDETDLDRVLERQLAVYPLTQDTFGDVLLRIREYLGDETGTFLLDLLSRADPTEFLDSLHSSAKYSEDQVESARRTFLRLRALHGPVTQAMFAIWQMIPDDWRTMDRNVYIEQATQTWQIRLTFDKYNGERFIIQGQPPSILNLALFVMVTLTQIDRSVPFDNALLSRFQDEVAKFSSMFLDTTSAPVPLSGTTSATASQEQTLEST